MKFQNNHYSNLDDELDTIDFEEYDDYQSGGNYDTYHNKQKYNNQFSAKYTLENKQTGGNYYSEYITSLRDQISKNRNNQKGGDYDHDSLGSYEEEFYKMFNRAQGYRQRVLDGNHNRQNVLDNNQKGGAEAKRPLNDTMQLMSDIVEVIKKSGKDGGLIRSQLMSVAKLIVDEAKENTNAPKKVNAQGKTVIVITPEVKAESHRLAKNPEKYVNIVKARPPKPRKSRKSKSSNKMSRNLDNRSRKQRGGDYDSYEAKRRPGQMY